MKTMLLSLCYILLFASFGCSQKYGISKSYAYSRKITAGNIPVDANNNPTSSGVQTAHIIYMETPLGETPVWDTAWVQGKAYSIQLLQVQGNRTTLGKTKEEEKDVIVEAKNGNALWQLLLTPLSSKTYSLTSPNAPILIRGTWNGKRVLHQIKKQTELATIFGE